jgi:hypothetical protein
VGDSVGYVSLCYDAEFGAWYEYWKEIGAIKETEPTERYVGFLRSGIFYIFLFEKTCFVMLRPTIVKQDENKRLHSTEGPALAFSDGTEIYKLHGVRFEKEWWEKIVNDTLSAEEVFAIDNLEHRRIAYQFMDKAKMKELQDFTVLDEVTDDGRGYPMRIVSFTVPEVKEPLKYYNCHCPTTGREYFLGTNEDTCLKAKAKSFGLEEVVFTNEW